VGKGVGEGDCDGVGKDWVDWRMAGWVIMSGDLKWAVDWSGLGCLVVGKVRVWYGMVWHEKA
jgi:hypothetical protein